LFKYPSILKRDTKVGFSSEKTIRQLAVGKRCKEKWDLAPIIDFEGFLKG
jgi:hypothetical protein